MLRKVITHKAFRYRVKPSPVQAARLARWESALRWLWNLAHEQRLMGLSRCRGEKVYVSYYDQARDLTALRKDLPWLADIPVNVCQSVLKDLDTAWQRCFQRVAGRPKFKAKARDERPALREPHPKRFRIDSKGTRFPKLGVLRTIQHRPTEGKLKTCALVREGDQWFVSIVCEVEINPKVRVGPTLGIDRGVTDLLATSDGEIVANPRCLERSLKRLARAQRTLARRKKGSNRRARAKHRVMCLHRKVRRQRKHHLHVQSARFAKSHGVIVTENLNVSGMVRGNLGRQISDAGWSQFSWMLRYKLERSGGRLVEVSAAYTSQTCFVCGVVDRASRKGKLFRCTACGHTDDADLNAARNIKARGNPSCQHVEPSAIAGPRNVKVVPKHRSSVSEPQSPLPLGRG